MKNKPYKITLSLELTPSMAMYLGSFIHQTVQGNFEFQKILTKKGKKEMMEIGQDIVNQVSEKTDWEKVKHES